MYVEWYGVCSCVVFSVVEICVDHGRVYVFHICFVRCCCCLIHAPGCCLLCCNVGGMWGCWYFCIICDSCSCRSSVMGNMCVSSSCRYSVVVSVVHSVAILSAVFCGICIFFKRRFTVNFI